MILEEPYTFRPPRVRRALQLAIGLPLSALLLAIAAGAAHLMWVPHRVHYDVADGLLTVTTGAPPFVDHRTISLEELTSVEAQDLPCGSKVAGTNLPGYCVGTYHYPGLGRVWQATDCGPRAVVLEVRGERRPLVLSPADRDAFLEAVRDRSVYRGGPPPSPHLPGWERMWLIAPVFALAAALMIPALFLWAPGLLTYRIEADHIRVRTILGRRRFPVAGCTARRHAPRVGLRLWGTAMPGYYTGLFRADHAKTRIYATNLKDGVLIEGGKLRLFLSPEEPAAFLEALRARTGVV